MGEAVGNCSSAAPSEFRDSALRLAPFSSTVYSCCTTRCADVRWLWYVCTDTVTHPLERLAEDDISKSSGEEGRQPHNSAAATETEQFLRSVCTVLGKFLRLAQFAV